MRDRLAERVRQFRATARPILSNGSVVIVLLMLVTSGVAAQVGMETFTDTFNDGNVDGWQHDADGWPQYATEDGNDTLYQETVNGDTRAVWVSGPELNMMEEFTITGTMKHTTASNDFTNRIGVFGDPNSTLDPVNALIVYDFESESTYLSAQEVPDSVPSDAVSNQFLNTWIQFEIYSPGNGTVYASVWGVTADKPDSYMFERNFSGTAGSFGVGPGGSTANVRQIWLDNVTIEGTVVPEDEEIELDTRDYIKPNESAPYSVHFNDSGQWSEVTDQATVTSDNTSVLTVDSVEHLLEGQAGVNATVNVTAEYTDANGTVYTTTKQITVAQATVDNLEILPAIWRFGATFGDDTIFFLIIATLTSIVATRFSTAFGGLSLYWVVVMLGWFSGWVSLGILLLATVMCMFIGLNLAANINYTKGISTDTASITEGRTRIRKRK